MMNRQLNRERNYVIDGNVVRNAEVAPKRTPKTPVRRELTPAQKREVRRENRQHRVSYRENENAFTMSVPYVIFLTVAVVCVVCLCIKFLEINSEISAVKGNISGLEDNIDALAAQNDSLDYEINAYVDVEYIQKVAKEELGMVNACEEQIRTYKSTDSEFMQQYGDIPKN